MLASWSGQWAELKQKIYIFFMKYRFAILSAMLAGFLAACDSGNSSSDPELTDEQKKASEDRHAIENTLEWEPDVCFYVENAGLQKCPIQTFRAFFQDWTNRHHEDTIVVKTRVTDIFYNPQFRKDTECSLSDITVFWDGTRAETYETSAPRAMHHLGIKVPETIYTQEHVLTIQMDSAKCANISQTIHFIPGEPSAFYNTASPGFNTRSSCTDGFFTYIHPDFQFVWDYSSSERAAYGDSLQSNCYLQKGADTLRLNLSFINPEVRSLVNASHAQAYLYDNPHIIDFIGKDSSATLKCALVYQSGLVPAKVENLTYGETEISFKECEIHSIKAITIDDSLRVQIDGRHIVNAFYGRVKNNGEYVRFKLEPENLQTVVDEESCNGSHCIFYKQFSYAMDDICGEKCLQTFDSLLIIASFSGQPASSLSEYLVFVPNKAEFPRDSSVIDSAIAAVIDSNGKFRENFRKFDVKQVANPLK